MHRLKGIIPRAAAPLMALNKLPPPSCPSFFRSFSSGGLVDPDTVRRIVVPPLSPTFEGGTLTQWTVEAGSEVSAYDVLFHVRTTSLTEPQSRADYLCDDADPSVELQIETVDDGFVGQYRKKVGEAVRPGDLLAYLVEDEENIGRVDEAASADPEAFAECMEFTWQAYTMPT